MFNLKEDVKEVNILPTSKGLPGNFLSKIERDKEKLDVTFSWENPSLKAGISMREFLPKRLEKMTDAEWKKNIQLSVSRLAHIARAYSTEEEFATYKSDNPSDSLEEKVVQAQWIEVTKKINKVLMEKIKSGEIRDAKFESTLKIVKVKNKDKWYTALPKVPAFISTPNHPKTLDWNAEYDFLEAPVKGGARPDQEIAQQGGGASAPTGGPQTPPPSTAASGSDDF
jgi:hypothetical protein